MRVVPLLFSSVSGRKNVLIHYIIKSESPVIQTNYRTFAFVRVELVGFEPTSAQGNHTLSTRLFQPLIFVQQQDLDHQLKPYPLNFHQSNEAYYDYSRFSCTALPSDSEQHPWSSVSFHHLMTELC